MWILFAFLSAFFAGITSILAKCGIKRTDSDIATAIRTIVVLFFSIFMVMITDAFSGIYTVEPITLVFLILSGLATGASWLCYFKALQLGDINKVVPVDKSSVLISIIFAVLIFKEYNNLPVKVICFVMIAVGTYMMIVRKKNVEKKTNDSKWFIYASLSALFASLTSILGKIGITNIDSNLGTSIRTFIVLIMSWAVVFITKRGKDKASLYSKKELPFIILSGIATGASWLCYYKALQDGDASIVVPIDKLSILITVIFSFIVFKEKLNKKSLIGLILIVVATLCMTFMT